MGRPVIAKGNYEPMNARRRRLEERVNNLLSTLGRFAAVGSMEPFGHKIELLFTYARLKLKAWFFSWAPVTAPTQERFLGWRVRFPDYNVFVFLFEEQFVEKLYRVDIPNDDPVILDCGANIGMSILFFRRYYPHCKIIAFEPDPEMFEILKQNIERNGLADVELHNKAVAKTQGQLMLSVDPDRPSGIHSTVVAERDIGRTVIVEAVRLSDCFDKADILKLDIEGAESQVIEELHASRRLNDVLQMILEYHHHLLDNEKSELAGFLRILEHNGWNYHLSSRRVTWGPRPRSQDIIIHAYQPQAATGWPELAAKNG